MVQRLIVGFLVASVLGAVGIGVYDSNQVVDENTVQVLANGAQDNAVLTTQATTAEQQENAPGVPASEALVISDTAPDAAPVSAMAPTPGPVAQPQVQEQATDMVGDPWAATGTILEIQTNGFLLALADGSEIFVELGPSYYWQSQDVILAVGDAVTVDGFYNGEQYHAATVTQMDGSQITVRTETGQPLWSGGTQAQNGEQPQPGSDAAGNGAGQGQGQGQTQSQGQGQGQSQGQGQGQGQGQSQVQVAPEDWMTIEGTVTAIDNTVLTMQTTTGDTLTLQLGDLNFVQEQGVSFVPGDEISVLGFWQGTQFRAGEITNLATGERLMLLDPNGRPLWNGPGRAGGQSGQGQGGQGQGQGQDGQGQGQGNGNGNGNSGQGGNGNGYRGGRQ